LERRFRSQKESINEGKVFSKEEAWIIFLILNPYSLSCELNIFALMTDITYSYAHLRDFTLSVFKRIGCPLDQAELATEVLLNADLRGIDSHGIARLSGYVRLWDAKRVMQNRMSVLFTSHPVQP
jgi:hypothetical protein